MEAALAVAALGDSQSLFLESDPIQEQSSNDLLGLESQNVYHDGTNGQQQNVFAHTSEQHHVIASQQSMYSQGQLPQYDSCNTQPAVCAESAENLPQNECESKVKDELLQPAGSVHEANHETEEPQPESPVIDIIINNVVCSFSTRCHLNLKRIALEGSNVIFKKESGVSILPCLSVILSQFKDVYYLREIMNTVGLKFDQGYSHNPEVGIALASFSHNSNGCWG